MSSTDDTDNTQDLGNLGNKAREIRIDVSQIELHSGRIVIGYSGGLDSHVLLHLIKRAFPLRAIYALHINHALHHDSDKWEVHCEDICRELEVEYVSQKVQVDRTGNLENEARKARYQAFETYLDKDDVLLLGHHQDDQIETLFLKMFRGDAPIGLQGMPMTRAVGDATLYRPLLTLQRIDLERYARDAGLEWIEDSSNQSLEFDRNFLRHQIIPQLTSRWPRLKKTLVQHEKRTSLVQSELLRLSELDYLEIALPPARLDLIALSKLSSLRQLNLMRKWLAVEGVQYLPGEKLLSESLNGFLLSGEESHPRMTWHGIVVERFCDVLYLHRALQNPPKEVQTLSMQEKTASIMLKNGRLILERRDNGGVLLKPDSLLSIRYRVGGEKMKFGEHHKSLKNIFQENNMPAFLRDYWPLIYREEELVLIPGISAWEVPAVIAPIQKAEKDLSAWSIDWLLPSGNAV